MNYLKTAFRVRLGLTNPCSFFHNMIDKIKPQFMHFPAHDPFNPTLSAIPSKLIAKEKIDNDYFFLRFSLPEENKCLGLRIGQYIWIELPDKSRRPYVPISRMDETGFVDLLVRDMSVLNKRSFTQQLLGMPIQSKVSIIGPGTQFVYEGFGKFKYINQSISPIQSPSSSSTNLLQNPISKTFKNIGIITHSSAITTTYSLIESIVSNFDNRTGVSLLWLGEKESDFIFINQFTSYVERYKLNMNLMLAGANQVGKSVKNWYGPYGKVMQKHIEDYMPFPGSNQIIIMSGLQGEFSYIPNMVKEMGYKDFLNF